VKQARPIGELGLGVRTTSAVQRVADRLKQEASIELLLSLAAEDLLSMPGFGRKALSEVEAALSSRGLVLRAARRLRSHHANRPADGPADCGETREPGTTSWPNVTCSKCLSGRTSR
jgi:hypothetical protein